MTFLSLFMTRTGIFCFVPISHRLIESGIVPASKNWRLWRPPSVLVPTFYSREEDRHQLLLAADKIENTWTDAQEYHRTQSPPQIQPYSAEDTFTTDQQPTTPCVNEWSPVIVSPLQCSPAHSFLQSTPIDTLYGRESTSFTSVTQDSSLCDSCNTLLRREIPPDHIPSVIRALALLEAQDRLSDVGFSEFEVAALTNAFSMLRI